MTQPPRLEARVRAQERMQNILSARIEELAEDMTASFQQQANYQIQTERRIEARFEDMRADIAVIKTNMALKEDVTFISEDMTASFRQLVDYHIQTEQTLDARFNKIEAKIATIETTMATKEDIAALEARMTTNIDALETRMVSNMTAMENRMVDAFKQLLITKDTQHTSTQG